MTSDDDKQPTDRQLAYARALARALKCAVPSGYTRREMSVWLTRAQDDLDDRRDEQATTAELLDREFWPHV